MKKRLITAGILILIVAGVLGLSSTVFPIAFDILVLAITGIGVYEVSSLLDKQGKPNYWIAGCIFAAFAFAASIVCILVGWNALVLFITFVVGMAVAFGLCMIIPLCFKSAVRDNPFRQATGMSQGKFLLFRAFNTVTLFVYPVFLSFFMYFLNHITGLGFNNITFNFNGYQLPLFSILLVIVITCFTDTMAFFTGSLLHGPKLAPSISPNKTISGAIGGLIGGVVGAVVLLAVFRAIMPIYTLIKFWQIILVGLAGSIATQCGDLFESYMKRKSQVKDAGNILPGHGGVMDRVDGMLFNVPIVFVSLIIMLA